MSVDDESTADAYADHVQLQGVLGRDFDPYKVIRISSKDARSMSVSMPEWFRRAIDSLHGNGRRFRNRSEFVVHACAVAYRIEQGLSPEVDAVRSLYDPIISRLELENALDEQAHVDKVIEIAGANISNSDRTVRDKTRIELQRVRRICEDHEDLTRVKLIDDILHRSGS